MEIDNNTVEKAIRLTAVGKKNWLFVGDGEAGDRGAILYTVVESCRRRGINPYAYLREVLERIPAPRIRNWTRLRRHAGPQPARGSSTSQRKCHNAPSITPTHPKDGCTA